MTVTYTSEVTTCQVFSSFLRLLGRWKGSIYKIVWSELLIFLTLYYTLNLSYRFLMDKDDKQVFEKLVQYCEKYSSLVPLSFVLGFYVNLVMTRWWNQYTAIPSPDNLAILVGACIKGQNDHARMVRRTIVRYVCVTFTITLTMISPKVKKRFPTLNHFMEAGLLTRHELKIMEKIDIEYPNYSKHWLPLAWASNIAMQARHEGLIHDDESVRTILDELNNFRSQCGRMLDYDWISVPLVYTQVVTLAVYSYFIVTAIGQQHIESNQEIDLYFPVLPVLEFFFYMGWLKVAETLINPYGEDDDDFEVVWMVDRHLQVSYLLVDRIQQIYPRLMKDQHWAEIAPNILPYTVASQSYMNECYFHSTHSVRVPKKYQDVLVKEDDDTETDGSPTEGSRFWRLFPCKTSLKNRRNRSRFSLKTVTALSGQPNEQDCHEIINDDTPIQIDNKMNYSEEFEKLKKDRMEEHKARLLKYFELLNKR